MKTVIMGTSGSEKSTLACLLGRQHGVPVMHLDAVHFLPGWVERSLDEERADVSRFLDKNSARVIDGNYTKTCFARRLAEADEIVVLNLNRFACLAQVVRRWRVNRGCVRPSSAVGCVEKLDMGFVRWVLCDGRSPARLAVYKEVRRQYPKKTVVLASQREIDDYLKKSDILIGMSNKNKAPVLSKIENK